jgi:GntR family transcriptional regulator
VHVLTRVRRAGLHPVVLQHSYLGENLRSVVEQYSPERSLYAMVREATGRVPLTAQEIVRSTILDEPTAAALAVPAGSVGWLAVRTTFDAQGQPLVFDEAHFPSERVEIHIERRAAATQTSFRIICE